MRTLDQRRKVEFMYVVLEVHLKILRHWIAIVLFPTLVNAGGGVVICLYIPIRHPEVPLLLNICFLVVAAILLAVIFGTSYDAVLVIRGVEDLLGKLKTFDAGGREDGISDLQRSRLLKRAKACRPMEVPIGTFGEFSLDVPVIMWDEILNQLLFLLSF